MKLTEVTDSPSLPERKRYALKFQQELVELSDTWTSKLIKVGMIGVGLEVRKAGETAPWLLKAIIYNGEPRMMNDTFSYNIYFPTAQDWIDYAYENKL